MDFIPIEELAESSGKSRRTIDRKLIKLQKSNPELFDKLTKRDSGHAQGSRRILYSPEIIQHIGGVGTKLIQEAKEDLKTIKAEINKEKRERKKKIDSAVTPEIISIDPVDDAHQEDFALFQEIIADYKTGELTLPESITRHNIDHRTFTYWVNTRPAFASLYNAAYKIHRKAYNDYLRELAKESLKKMVTGYDKIMESTTFLQKVGPNGAVIQIPQERKVQQRYVMPNVNAIIFALTNKDPEEWRRVFGNSVMPQKTEQDPMENMSDAELMSFLEEAKLKGLLTAGENK